MRKLYSKNFLFRNIAILLFIFLFIFGNSPLITFGRNLDKTLVVEKDKDKHDTVYLGGYPIGIKLKTKGFIVISLSEIENYEKEPYSPASEGGIKVGDNIISINEIELKNSNDITEIINKTKGNTIKIKLLRDNIELVKEVKPVKCVDDNYKLGLWIRDSTAGVGTLTFYDKKNNIFGALGHGIIDSDTNVIMPIEKGDILSAEIKSIKRGEKGNPGELRGIFVNETHVRGEITKNSLNGVFGISNESLENIKFNEPIKVAKISEIKEGNAQILTTVDADGPKYYDIKIEKVLDNASTSSKNMLIVVTDEELLSKTGGIVQGMSGSPIIQNGKLVGAVNHVLVNNPCAGYGIFIETMLNELNKGIK
ncbi:SpoIVB peptidase [Clostridium bornimense]|uniref:SpoIVB peptidase n=1 Tax=Clostridium bornimense TaxID=1216932 RepID=UPI001C107035|nr:SpoIVB peptidase [Clostridium bornimense]MBU5315837.1 SpoIVB peptidase [Clostridium bornimense]